ncbi:MAG: hypothetical protein KKC20_05980 [Proteobacteria bacterium]|nr:hypothetical protein [Pseudomonadota bacterium]
MKKIDAAPLDPFLRPSWHDHFMGICNRVASCATSTRPNAGAVFGKEKRLLFSFNPNKRLP